MTSYETSSPKAGGFFQAGNLPTLFSALLYLEISFIAWALLGPLAVYIAPELHLSAGQKGFMVAVPVLAGALLRLPAGGLSDAFGPKRVGVVAQLVVIAGLILTWTFPAHTFGQMFWIALVLGVAGASFAIGIPLASAWYPSKYQGAALGIVGIGNSGTALAALFAPELASVVGWRNVIGLTALPLALTLLIFLLCAQEPPKRGPAPGVREWLTVLRAPDSWFLMFFYAVTFGGFVGLSAFLTIYFNDQYHLSPTSAGACTAFVVLVGSLVRPLGGGMADKLGGTRALALLYAVSAAVFGLIALGLPTLWGAMSAFFVGMFALGLGNGAVFQLVPSRFAGKVGVATGLVGMAGGVGGFFLASSLGATKQLTGSYGDGFLGFALICLLALAGDFHCRKRWRKPGSP